MMKYLRTFPCEIEVGRSTERPIYHLTEKQTVKRVDRAAKTWFKRMCRVMSLVGESGNPPHLPEKQVRGRMVRLLAEFWMELAAGLGNKKAIRSMPRQALVEYATSRLLHFLPGLNGNSINTELHTAATTLMLAPAAVVVCAHSKRAVKHRPDRVLIMRSPEKGVGGMYVSDQEWKAFKASERRVRFLASDKARDEAMAAMMQLELPMVQSPEPERIAAKAPALRRTKFARTVERMEQATLAELLDEVIQLRDRVEAVERRVCTCAAEPDGKTDDEIVANGTIPELYGLLESVSAEGGLDDGRMGTIVARLSTEDLLDLVGRVPAVFRLNRANDIVDAVLLGRSNGMAIREFHGLLRSAVPDWVVDALVAMGQHPTE